MTPAEFLSALWTESPSGWVLIWTLDPISQEKHSIWLKSFHAIGQIVEMQSRRNVYMGCSLAADSEKVPSSRVRVKNEQAAGIAGLWADIDIKGQEHSKTNLPLSKGEALDALKDFQYQPSITVNSGHGLQCWWLFCQPWVFKDAYERQCAQQLCVAWHGLLSQEWAKHGWALDATHDLARVMRLPGTKNYKGSMPVKVEVIQQTDFRWRALPNLPSTKLPLSQQNAPNVSPAEVGLLELDPTREPPWAKLNILMSTIDKFRASWENHRPDFESLDQSASAMDMSIASWCAAAGFTDQEIADTLVRHRLMSGADLKLRQDYYRKTIGKVRGNASNQ